MSLKLTINHRGETVKMGKRHAVHDPRALMLANYLKPNLPPAPPARVWSGAVDAWPMYLNDQLGDCTCAAAGHMIEGWTANGQHKEIKITDAQVQAAYQKVGGYVPGDPSTDGGAVELDVLKYWRKHGIGGHKITAFASVSPHNIEMIKDAVNLTGGAYIGLSLPETAQSQKVWDVPPGGPRGRGEPGSWGGHAVNIIDYDTRGVTVVTWGALHKASWAFLQTYCDEAYAILTPDFLDAGKAPNGFDVAALTKDLAAFT